jgi:ELWxxDGT repeat protein
MARRAGTAMVKDLNPVQNLSSTPTSLTRAAGNVVYFIGTRARTGGELWRSDGTPGGTYLVKDIRPGSGGQKSSSMLYVGDTLYFTADDGVHGSELWRSDGTEAGTVLVKDIFPGVNSGTVKLLTAVGNTLYLQAGDALNDYELWKSDGTAAGTLRVKDITPGAGQHLDPASDRVQGAALLQLWLGRARVVEDRRQRRRHGEGESRSAGRPT